MKYLTKISFLTAAVLTLLFPLLVAVHLVGASGTATLSLSPASNTVAPGDTLDIAIHEDSGSNPTNGVQANLSYSAGTLSFVGITDSPDFGVDAQCSSANLSSCGSGGTLSIARGTCLGCAPVTGDKIVATVHFKTNSSGTGTVNFGARSAVVSSIDHLAMTLTTSGGTYTITSPATMSLSPATKTVSQGSSFSVDIYEDSDTDGVNGVQANLSYPSNLLTFAGAVNSAAWPIEAQSSASGGVIKIGRGISAGSSPLTGKQLVATLKFNAAGPGNAVLDFITGTGLIRASDNSVEPTKNNGGSYSITAAPVSGGGSTTKASGSSVPPPKSVTSSVSQPVSPGGPIVSTPVTAPVDNQGPIISGITVTNLTTNSATINWTTSEPATSEVDYGLSTKLILSTSDTSLATSHSIKLNSKELVGHKKYHFMVKSTDAAGNVSTSKDMTFSTGGVQITTTEIAIAAGAAVLGGGTWLAAAGGLKLGGMTASAGGIYIEPKPIIVGGAAPPPPVVQPQAAIQKPAAPVAQPAPSAGKVITPKTPAAKPPEGPPKPPWVK